MEPLCDQVDPAVRDIDEDHPDEVADNGKSSSAFGGWNALDVLLVGCGEKFRFYWSFSPSKDLIYLSWMRYACDTSKGLFHHR